LDPLARNQIKQNNIILIILYTLRKLNTLENEHIHSFSREWWQRATSLKNERVCSFPREEGGGGDGKEQLPLFSREKGGDKEQPASKTSIHARFGEGK